MTREQQTEIMKQIQAARRATKAALAANVDAGDYTAKLVEADEALEDALHATGLAVAS